MSGLTPQQLLLLDKGPFSRIKHVTCTPWRGMENPAKPLFNQAQADENKKLYPHLFRT